MFNKINFLFFIFLLLAPGVQAQKTAVKLTPKEIAGYKTECRQMMEYLEGTLNFLGNPENPPAEKEIIINNSYLKIFQNDKVQIEGDLDAHRVVPIHKDVQAYLKDVVFFFKKVHFTFHITNIQPLQAPDGQIYFKVTLNRTLKGITVNGDTVENNQLRYVEINLDPEQNSLKIASIYTNKPTDDAEIEYWWNTLSPAWKNYFGKAIRVYDSIPLNHLLSFSDKNIVVEIKKVYDADSLNADSARLQQPEEDSLLVVSDSVVWVPDTLPMKNTGLMIQLVRHLREAREVNISGNLDIENLQPLSEMDNLRTLNCAHTLIDDLTPLRTLSRLEYLDITGCPVESLEPLRYISSLRELDAAYTPVKKIKVLAGLRNLEAVNLSHTRVDSIPNFQSLVHLRSLELNAVPAQKIDSLASLTRLTALSLARSHVKDFSPLSSMRALQTLNLDSTLIIDLHPLSTLDSLTILQINGTRVSDLMPLAGLKSLKYIYCDNSGVHLQQATAFHKKNPHCQVIFNSQKLEKWWASLSDSWKNIFISHTGLQPPITKEQLHKLLLIKKLDLHGNSKIHSLQPLVMLIRLKSLNVSGTSVSSLQPLAALRTLQNLDVSYTRVTSLEPLKNLTNLQKLNIENTAVSDLMPLAGSQRLQLILADHSKVNEKNVLALQKHLPQCLVIFQSDRLKIWWNNLEKPWQQAFEQQLDMNNPPTPGQIQQLINLEKINVTNHLDIDNVEPLTLFKRLKNLRLDNTSVTDISPLAEIKTLRILSITNGPLWDISPLVELKQLEVLKLENTSVEDLSPIQGLHQLQKLNISGTKVKNLKPLSGLTRLQELIMNNTRVSTLKYIMALPHLTLVRCDHTYLRKKKVDNFKEKHPKTRVIFY
ncbi:leucine-rich repeat domain-containing protein [Candidatus Sulfidibacterium hydrothermale]|uniref:leucine-rich repeat domain-containing protein n=1 Tax=Candidatus Sulfidibacterium hydrothermale TaxID=2875962 RepID=UPI001F0A45DD|nr:leucine-rich repeat domain-containing protein [Candidatus Sulfidibacterium hydrothermale]UBM62278.1 leucine-rich repeat domain-containing protein [Candidatus Sulfidibacterium hydrothermale]